MYGYIYNDYNLTKDDIFILCRRTITCRNPKPLTEHLGNGYKETFWLGDITKDPGYEEYDPEYLDNGICTI